MDLAGRLGGYLACLMSGNSSRGFFRPESFDLLLRQPIETIENPLRWSGALIERELKCLLRKIFQTLHGPILLPSANTGTGGAPASPGVGSGIRTPPRCDTCPGRPDSYVTRERGSEEARLPNDWSSAAPTAKRLGSAATTC